MDEEISPAVLAARARLREKLGAQQLGGKGTARRKAAKVHRAAGGVGDEKKLQQTAKKLGAASIFGVEEVHLLQNNGRALFFKNPKVQAAPAANMYILTGTAEDRENTLGILSARAAAAREAAALAPELIKRLQQQTANENKDKDGDNDDEVPDLVQNFEEVSKE
ncbi:NAC domain containing protein, putative [Eimeria acervulina]|uniref:Nascent polypeptide-associated complex subunit beta n=1 Tax=Eimeria acervulina TaxID=5801 RepID=U6GCR2_EIMAC|nr:NAC domain containing protein, putative [Eimeria acervulina]CDI77108.1 NAC domain containing protein, putative [Eimeria acervulina]